MLLGVAAAALAAMVPVGVPAALRRPATSAAAADLRPDLARYRQADLELAGSGGARPGVVFMGDSITQLWPLAASFPRQGYLDRGIAGQTSGQILGRFGQDVMDLDPRVVVLLAGSNDLRLDLPASLTEANLARMVALAHSARIAVVLCTLPPVRHFPSAEMLGPRETAAQEAARLQGQAQALNGWIRSYAAGHGLALVDYYGALAGPDGGWGPGLTADGIHPSLAGYARMAPLVQRAIDPLLVSPPPPARSDH